MKMAGFTQSSLAREISPVWVYTGENLDSKNANAGREASWRCENTPAEEAIDYEKQVRKSNGGACVRFRNKRFRVGRRAAAMGLWIYYSFRHCRSGSGTRCRARGTRFHATACSWKRQCVRPPADR